MDQKTQFIAD
jgi:putative transposase